MKIRTDFVTNSSSSSFITFTIKDEKLASIINKYDVGLFGLSVRDDEIYLEEYSTFETLSMGIIDSGLDNWIIHFFQEVKYCEHINEEKSEELIQEIKDNRDEIISSLKQYWIKMIDKVTDGFSSYNLYILREDGSIKTEHYDEKSFGSEESGWEFIKKIDSSIWDEDRFEIEGLAKLAGIPRCSDNRGISIQHLERDIKEELIDFYNRITDTDIDYLFEDYAFNHYDEMEECLYFDKNAFTDAELSTKTDEEIVSMFRALISVISEVTGYKDSRDIEYILKKDNCVCDSNIKRIMSEEC